MMDIHMKKALTDDKNERGPAKGERVRNRQ